MNNELRALYEDDRREHAQQPRFDTREYWAMRARDRQRRGRVIEWVEAQPAWTAEESYQAAWIMNHGETPGDAERAHALALRASELGHRPARWLAAASYDRWQMYQGKPQKYGTNYLFDGRRDRLWDVDPRTSDEERAAWDVPPLAEQRRKADDANRQRAPLPEAEVAAYLAKAPEWARAILAKWRDEERDA